MEDGAPADVNGEGCAQHRPKPLGNQFPRLPWPRAKRKAEQLERGETFRTTNAIFRAEARTRTCRETFVQRLRDALRAVGVSVADHRNETDPSAVWLEDELSKFGTLTGGERFRPVLRHLSPRARVHG